MKGTIFSIEEFSTFDGPGIRATVFLKGCPLRCQWCHNPEGQSFQKQYMRSPNGCLHCGACMVSGQLTEESIAACPRDLIRRCGEDLAAEELVSRLLKLLPMVNAAGGGITFSGGEPLSQPTFLLECLKLLHGRTHRAVQTSGYAPQKVFHEILNNCDYVLYDLKLMDSSMHKRFTGVNNEKILQNYLHLAKSGVPFITRIPLIPGVNDDRDNLTATAAFMQKAGARKIELLPYNTGAGAKYKAAGMTYAPQFDTGAVPAPHSDIFEDYGIEVTVL